MIIREIEMPEDIAGRLSTCAMPGRTGEWKADLDVLAAAGVDVLLSLTPADEVGKEGAGYAQAITGNAPRFIRWARPTPDFGVTRDRTKFVQEVQNAAKALREGRRIIVQCGAGIGRSGTFAIAVLMALGLSQDEANERIE